MQASNKKITEKYHKAERARMNKLVDTAYRNDPRVKKEEARELAEKEKKKQDIRDKKEKQRLDLLRVQQAFDEEKRKEEEEVKRLEEEQKL